LLRRDELLLQHLAVFPAGRRPELSPGHKDWPPIGEPPPPEATTPSVPAEVLRRLTITDLVSSASYQMAQELGGDRQPSPRERAAIRANLSENPGRRGREDAHFAGWAVLYVNQRAKSRSPIASLAQQYGLDREQVRDVVHRARSRGLLGRGSSGVLTEKAKAIIASPGFSLPLKRKPGEIAEGSIPSEERSKSRRA
jgi:transposase-like protein